MGRKKKSVNDESVAGVKLKYQCLKDPLLERSTVERSMLEISPPEVGAMSLNKMMAGLLFLIFLSAPLIGQTKEAVKGEALLRQLEADFAADVAKHGHDAFITHFADDGVEVVDGGGFNDKDAMRNNLRGPRAQPLHGGRSKRKWRLWVILATRTALTSTLPKTKMANWLRAMASTPRFGKNKRTASGKW